MLRATNTGMTAIIDHLGRVSASLAPFTQGTLTGSVQGRSGATPFVRWGNAPLVLLALLACVVYALGRRKPAAAPAT
jgi:apolipoprotein N-acyltransferase